MDYGVINETDGNAIKTEKIFHSKFTRDLTSVSGPQAVTGVGFKPSYVIFHSVLQGTQATSWGMDTGPSGQSECIRGNGTTDENFYTSTQSIYVPVANGSTGQFGNISSFDSDGFTITWSKFGSPTGTATILFTAYR
jgi:hypothetical protein